MNSIKTLTALTLTTTLASGAAFAVPASQEEAASEETAPQIQLADGSGLLWFVSQFQSDEDEDDYEDDDDYDDDDDEDDDDDDSDDDDDDDDNDDD